MRFMRWLFHRNPVYISGTVHLKSDSAILLYAGTFRVQIEFDGEKVRLIGYTNRGFKVMHLGGE